ncbi:MAG: hypothetical protein ACU836_16250 [Gammaproteobacteria bacterium]
MTDFDHHPELQRVTQLNRECQCVSLDRAQLRTELSKQTDGDALFRMICEERPHLIADQAVFVAESCLQRQRDVIEAIEHVISLPAYRERVLVYAPASARYATKATGVFLGYDFHLSVEGSRLIEINTNAGGALVNLMLTRAYNACGTCPGSPIVPAAEDTENAMIAMFRNEWRLAGHRDDLRTIAIVDESPEQQYMLPEFLLFRNLFVNHGINAIICDPSELSFRGHRLWHGDKAIDLVYNRLTDFALEESASAALRDAYLSGAAVVTPHPRNHALYADKRNLALLTDEKSLQEMGVDTATRSIVLQGIAKTEIVRPADADDLWQRRKQLFFKPAKGYGSKAAYRGDKLTKRVFTEILQSDYVAQSLVHPSERQLRVQDQAVGLKLDLRHYVYQGQTQIVCTRLYQGQTTNFRTPGGGFAQVIEVRDDT